MPDKHNELSSMLGNIKYRIYNKEKNFNFRLPTCRLFNNSDIEKNMVNLIVDIDEEKIHEHLHALSKVFYCKLSIMAFFHQFAPFLKCIFT